MSDAPKRACRFVLDLEADTQQDIVSALISMAHQIERDEMTQGVSGGYSSGYIYELTLRDRPTHSEWAANLRAYLDAKKDGAGVAGTEQRLAAAARRFFAAWCADDENEQQAARNDIAEALDAEKAAAGVNPVEGKSHD